MNFEAGFAETERVAGAAAKTVAVLAGSVKQLQKAASEGDIQRIRRLSERLVSALESTQQEVENARSAWPFSGEEEEQYLRESYADEVLDAAKAETLQIQQRDEGLVAFPSILRILPSERAVRINRKKVQGVRPSRVVKTLKAIQTRRPKGAPEQFLEVLQRAYRMLAGKEYGKTVALANIYNALTLLPGSTVIYDQTDFVRDLYLLDSSGVTRTRSGATCSLPASTGTKTSKGTYSFIGPDGETVTYYGIRFTEEAE
ncbi:MAG TPA: hypothetical protein VM120_24695 [Bryobacteraceae bacterium]|nr:hypothetical protein [Bryobacteraceae bacterium]